VKRPLRILVANEPRLCREALAETLQELRPHAEVTPVEPEDLDRAIISWAPQMVVCSALPRRARCEPFAWMVLPSDGEPRAVVSIAGQHTTVANPPLTSILAVVDQTEAMAHVSPWSFTAVIHSDL